MIRIAVLCAMVGALFLTLGIGQAISDELQDHACNEYTDRCPKQSCTQIVGVSDCVNDQGQTKQYNLVRQPLPARVLGTCDVLKKSTCDEFAAECKTYKHFSLLGICDDQSKVCTVTTLMEDVCQ